MSGISHRAFGGIKSMVMSTDSPTSVTVGYDAGLRPASYVATNGANEGDIQNAEYSYNNDGLISAVNNTAEPEFDQTSKYDFAGRLKMNSAGPVSQQLKYDAFNNLTERENNFYTYEDRFVAGYTNNRKTSSGSAPVYDTYDNAGNVVESLFNPYTPHGDRPYNDSKWWTFDAAGRVSYFSQYTTASGTAADARETKHDTAFDGDGRPVMENKRERMCWLASSPANCTGTWVGYPAHYLISSVTGQKINTMYDGENSEKHVYMGGTNIAREVLDGETLYRGFTTTDPVIGSTAPMAADGTVSDHARTELAALGTAIPLSAPPPSLPPPSSYENGFAGDAEYGCVDEWGDRIPCRFAQLLDRYIGGPKRGSDPFFTSRLRANRHPLAYPDPRYGINGLLGGFNGTGESGGGASTVDFVPVTLPDDFRKRVELALGGACNDFIKKVIAKAVANQNARNAEYNRKVRGGNLKPISANAVDGFAVLKGVTGFVFGNQSMNGMNIGTINGKLGVDAKIDLGPTRHYWTPQPRGYDAQEYWRRDICWNGNT